MMDVLFWVLTVAAWVAVGSICLASVVYLLPVVEACVQLGKTISSRMRQ